MRALALVPFACLGLAAVAGAATLTLDLDTCPVPPACDEPWQEGGCTLTFVSTTAEDFGAGYCVPMYSSGTWLLMGVRLTLGLGPVQGLTAVEVDVNEAVTTGLTRAFLYEGGILVDSAVTTQSGVSTLHLTADGAVPDLLAVSGAEAALFEIRLIGDTLVGAEPTTFGAVKGLYR